MEIRKRTQMALATRTFLALIVTLSACGVAELSDAERAWCARHPRSVATSMDSLDLLTPIEGEDSFELWVAVLDSYFAGDVLLGADLLSAQQESDADRGCKAAFEGR
jgi:hypothetical protein